MKTISTFSKNFYEELGKNAPRVDVRQTVLTGPRDANGRADFLQDGTGLELVTKNVSSLNPLTLTFGDGFSSFGQKDITKSLETLKAVTLPDNESRIFIYIDLNGEDFTMGFSLLDLDRNSFKPTTPATTQSWYPYDHSSKGAFFDGIQWVDVNRVFIGEATTSAGAITNVESYDFLRPVATQVLDLTGLGNFTAGKFVFSRIQNTVSAIQTEVLTYLSGTSGGATGIVHEWARPLDVVRNINTTVGNSLARVDIFSDGSIGTSRYDSSLNLITSTTNGSGVFFNYIAQ